MRKPPLRHGRPSAAYPVQQHGYYSVNEGDGSAILAGDESFADLFAASLNSPRKAVARRDPELGELVQGEIIQIGTDFAFLDIGGKDDPARLVLDHLGGRLDQQKRTFLQDELDLAHVADVEQPDAGAHGLVLFEDGLVLHGHRPAPEVDDARPKRYMSLIKRGAARGGGRSCRGGGVSRGGGGIGAMGGAHTGLP